MKVAGPAQVVAADEGGGGDGRGGEGGQEGASHMYLARDVAEVRAGVGASAEEKEGGGGGGGEGEGEGEGDREGEGKKEGERLREGEGDDMGGYPVGRLGFRRQFSRMLQQLVRFKPDLVLLSLLSLSVLGCVLPRAHALVACCQMNHSRALRGITHSLASAQNPIPCPLNPKP